MEEQLKAFEIPVETNILFGKMFEKVNTVPRQYLRKATGVNADMYGDSECKKSLEALILKFLTESYQHISCTFAPNTPYHLEFGKSKRSFGDIYALIKGMFNSYAMYSIPSMPTPQKLLGTLVRMQHEGKIKSFICISINKRVWMTPEVHATENARYALDHYQDVDEFGITIDTINEYYNINI